MPSLDHLQEDLVLKIISYLEGNPWRYMEFSLTSKRLFRISTSDAAWRRFNVFSVKGVYGHFLKEFQSLPRLERDLYYTPTETWSDWIGSTDVNKINPYTQLLILLQPLMFGALSGQISDRRVMERGVLEPGNLLFYACNDIRCDPYLARRSLKSRQREGLCTVPQEWGKELTLAWMFAYANHDAEFRAPFSAELYDYDVGERATPHWLDHVLFEMDRLDEQTELHMKYLTKLGLSIVKMGDRYYPLRSVPRRPTDDRRTAHTRAWNKRNCGSDRMMVALGTNIEFGVETLWARVRQVEWYARRCVHRPIVDHPMLARQMGERARATLEELDRKYLARIKEDEGGFVQLVNNSPKPVKWRMVVPEYP